MADIMSKPVAAVEFVQSSRYNSALPETEDPFRHLAGANSHNHHELHPWGSDIAVGTPSFDSLYAQANNCFMYHIWYSNKLAPYLATQVLKIQPLSDTLVAGFQSVLQDVLEIGIDAALQSPTGRQLIASVQSILDDATNGAPDAIFVRLGATSAKDSFAKGAPTTKPGPMAPSAELVLRRLLTSGRVVGRMLALRDRVWPDDPGEALVVQRWAPHVELCREIRVFCYAGRVTAVSQDIWWEKMGWRDRYSDGFVQAIVDVWAKVKEHLPFDTCTMDVLMTPPTESDPWKAEVIEFNGFGAHLNTGSDLYHWVKDADILQGKTPTVAVRFVDDWEDQDLAQTLGLATMPSSTCVSSDKDEPDWLVLERELQGKYANKAKDSKRIEIEEKNTLPLRGHWCSAY